MQARLAILLPTFNGEKYLAEQIDSLLAQSYRDFIVVIRDDGSTDGTVELIQSYLAEYPEVFHYIENDGSNLGASGSFSMLMQYVLDHKKELGLKQAYMMFCDQDDVWNPDKVARQLQLMAKLEGNNPSQPALIHSELRVVSADGATMAESFMAYQGLNAGKNRLADVILSNIVTGCTALLNESLARRALPVPASAIMHDWWLAIVAAAFGQLHFIESPLVDYRQHGENTIGAKQFVPKKIINATTLSEFIKRKPNPYLFCVAEQAGAFLDRYSQDLSFGHRLRLRLVEGFRSNSILVHRVLFRMLRL